MTKMSGFVILHVPDAYTKASERSEPRAVALRRQVW
jgi:hypothetical protein